jgi:hypothetical protein
MISGECGLVTLKASVAMLCWALPQQSFSEHLYFITELLLPDAAMYLYRFLVLALMFSILNCHVDDFERNLLSGKDLVLRMRFDVPKITYTNVGNTIIEIAQVSMAISGILVPSEEAKPEL